MALVYPRPLRQMIAIPLLLLVCLLGLCACAEQEAPAADAPVDSAAAAPADSALNAVQREMRLLDEAIRTSVTAIANNTPQVALAGIERVHAARAETEEFLHSGRYAPLANPDTLTAFAAEDAAFHGKLEQYAEALKGSSLDAAAASLGPVMQACVVCHARFRYRAAP